MIKKINNINKYYVQYPLGNSIEYLIDSPLPSTDVALSMFNGVRPSPINGVIFVPGNPIKVVFAMQATTKRTFLAPGHFGTEARSFF